MHYHFGNGALHGAGQSGAGVRRGIKHWLCCFRGAGMLMITCDATVKSEVRGGRPLLD